MATAAPPKYQQIIADLRGQIAAGTWSRGDVLPTYRALMQQYDATFGVVRQAMQVLQTDGLVESVPRVGCRVAQEPAKHRLIGLGLLGHRVGLDDLLEQGRVLHEQLERYRCDLAVRFIGPSDDEHTIESACAWARRLNGVILTGRVPLRLVQRLQQAQAPQVVIGEPADGPLPAGMSAVSVDVATIVRMGVSHLAGLGHKRIALDSGHDTRYYQLLRQAFECCTAEYGMEGLWLRRCDDGTRPSVDLVVQTLTTAKHPPTAVLAEGGHHASRLVQQLENAGWPVPQRISVVAISPTIEAEEVRPRLTCILMPKRELILRAVRMLNEQFTCGTPTLCVERVAAEYVPGDTCAPPPPTTAG